MSFSGLESRSSVAPRLGTDLVLAGRFRIVRFLARGGMGEVYEAFDLELNERVALKTVKPEIAADPSAVERFKREIQLSRKVTHPNVCRIFDVFHDRSPHGEVTFLTMELLDGETLHERLRRNGRLSPDEALPLVFQMTSGLQAAHEAGVIHRDFKSSNVMLTVTKASSGPIRAVITDFGLARGDAMMDGSVQSLSGSEIRGTPAYMAPEQLEGKEISPAADIYALGVVIYEMVTGAGPFIADTPFALAVKRLVEPPTSPRSHVPDLDRLWEEAILRCLERRPSDRFASADEVARAFRGELSAVKPKAWRRAAGLAVFGAIALFAGALGYNFIHDRTEGELTAPVGARRSVAVLGFKNLSGREDARWLSTALSEMLSAELASGQKLRSIPGENVARMKMDLSLPDADSFSQDTLERVRKYLGVDVIVLGSYLVLGKDSGGQIRLDLRIQDAATGETVATISETGTEALLLDLVSRGGSRLRSDLGVAAAPDVLTAAGRASIPSSPEAARFYAEGLRKLREFDAMGARDLLEKAVQATPDHPMPHSALAASWAALGYEQKAKDEARRAFELSKSLSREEQLSVEAGYFEMSRDYAKAIETYRTLFRFFPDNTDYGLRLAATERAAGRGNDALATLAALRKIVPPGSSDPRIDLEEAQAARVSGDFERQRVSAVKASTEGSLQGMRLLEARARLNEASALLALGDAGKAMEACQRAEKLYTTAGDRGGVSATLTQIANIHWQQGDLEAAKKMHTEVLKVARAMGNKGRMASALNNIGLVLMEEGQLSQATSHFEEAVQIQRELGQTAHVIAGLNNVGSVSYNLAQLDKARRAFDEAISLSRELGQKNALGTALTNAALTYFEQGDLKAAETMLQEAVAVNAQTGNRSSQSYSTATWGEILLAKGDLINARVKLEEALAIRSDLGEKGAIEESRLALAGIAIEEGRLKEAESLAHQVATAVQRENQPDSEALALMTLARSHLAQGQSAEARAAISRAETLTKTSESARVPILMALATARVATAEGRWDDARSSLERATADAERLGLYNFTLDARLALGELELKVRPDEGKKSLTSLQQDARAAGFGLIARKTSKLLR